jgi:hypothetical protein
MDNRQTMLQQLEELRLNRDTMKRLRPSFVD